MEIDKNTSYLIGFFQTDGHIRSETRNRGNASIELSVKDKDIIYKIAELIDYNYTIKTRNRKTTIKNKAGKIYNYDKDYISIRICKKEFRDILIGFGIPVGKKSEIIAPPLHLNNLSIPDYIRGLYDGDGSLGYTDNNFPFVSIVTSSKYIADFLLEYISKITNKPKKDNNPNSRDNIYNIVITREDAIIFCENIYYKDCFSMKRKYELSKEVKKWIRPDDMKKRDFDYKKWTKDENDYILNHTIEESIEKLNRTKKSIQIRLIRLKNNFLY